MLNRKGIAMMVGAIGGIVLIAAVFSSSSGNKARKPAADDESVLQQAAKVAEQRDELGEKLLNILTEDDATTVEEHIEHLRTLEGLEERRDAEKRYQARLEAVRLLGELQYLPAIPALIQNMQLSPVEEDEAMPPPAVDALAQYGDAAVPQIVEACLAEDEFLITGGIWKERSIYSLYGAIRRGDTLRTARIYARGIAATAQDPDMKRKVALFLKQLDKYKGA